MNTSAQQSGGGTQAATVGQGGLLAARTRNAGAPAAAIGAGARSAGEEASKRALDVQNENTQTKLKQQQSGLGGLEGLYGENLGGSINALGEVAPNVNANTQAANSSWDWAQDILDPLISGGAMVGSRLIPGSGGGGGGSGSSGGGGG